MKQFVIERDIPGVGRMDREQYKDVAATSNKALAKLAGRAQWVQTFVVDEEDLLHLPRRQRGGGARACSA